MSAWVEMPVSWGDPARRFVFGLPSESWQAERLDEVRPSLERVEAAQREGKFVVGFVSYEAAQAFDTAMVTRPKGALPLAWFAAYDSPSVFTEAAGASNAGSRFPRLPEQGVSSPETSASEYQSNVRRALEYIRNGDIYQVNYTVRCGVELPGDPLGYFRARLRATPMPHAAYLTNGQWAILSLSPELFIRRRGQVLESRPMKGTAAREPSWRDDETARRELERSAKNRAENTMIVDLVRNDLGRVCQAGSVHVPELCVSDRFPTVHQMTSLVRGKLCAEKSLFDIFAATFPPGSVTGAPKIWAMKIIRELEPEPRGVYCGTVGLFFPGGDFECNVAIRTLETARNKEQGTRNKEENSVHRSSFIAHRSILGLGSGIVADSDPGAEWEETLLKGRFLGVEPLPGFSLIETFGWRPGAGFVNLHYHLRRLRNSARYFGWEVDVDAVLVELRRVHRLLISEKHPPLVPLLGSQEHPPLVPPLKGGETVRIRILVSPVNVTVETAPLEPWSAKILRMLLYEAERVNSRDVLLFHKTTQRGIYDRAWAAARQAGADEAILMNERGELTEGTRTNLFVRLDSEWLTPALSCGLLPGVYRERQLEHRFCREAVLKLEDLERAEELRLGNSLRGEVKARFLVLRS